MQSLKASKEHVLKFPSSFSLKITRLTNPSTDYDAMATDENGDTADLPLSKKPRMFSKRSQRKKKTLPKPQELGAEQLSALNTPPVTPPLKCDQSNAKTSFATPELTKGISSSNYDEDDPPVDVFVSLKNYRRFSSRARKKPDFFHVSQVTPSESLRSQRARKKPDFFHVSQVTPSESLQSQRAAVGVKRKVPVPPAKRMLRFDDHPVLTQEAPLPSSNEPDGQDTDKYETMENLNVVAVYPQNSLEEADTVNSMEVEGSPKCDEESPEKMKSLTLEDLHERFPVGMMVWGKLPGYDWWPGSVISYDEGGGGGGEPQVWIKWYGDNQLSQIAGDRLAPFDQFSDHYHTSTMKGMYKKAVITALKEAARRCKMEFLSRPEDRKPRWIIPEGSTQPKLIEEEKSGGEGQSNEEEEGRGEEGGGEDSTTKSGSSKPPAPKGRKGRSKEILLTALEQEMLDWALRGFLPTGPSGLKPTSDHAVQVRVVPMSPLEGRGGGEGTGGAHGEEEAPRRKEKVMLLQIRKKARFDSVLEGKIKITDLCIGCGDMDVVADHPLFEGGLCKGCKNSFMEYAYLFDDDGTQMYCTICSGGEEVFMCDAENCAKVYCGQCIEKLCGIPELERVRAANQWLCYMCSPDHHRVGLLCKREDWDRKLQELFMNDHEMEYDPPPFYPAIPPEERRQMKVLGLFDGIATGLLVLKELGLELETYIASEIDPDAVKVSRVQHNEILHVGDIARITEKEVKAWGPFDLVMGGSPCNDLSIVNPARKGIYEGTGRLFFEFFRILTYARPAPGEDRPFFWLFENVVSMRAYDKQTISRFLQCNPVVVDAKNISAASRARYFWGNLPGMNRPTTPLPGDRLTLQECLEPHCFRTAQFTKLRTITTKMNSIKQTKNAIYPVRVEGGEEEEGDVLWCTEMERLFGFPDHYTDVANLGRCGRQRLLGKAWSVPVIRHLFSPLKDYFRSCTVKEPPSAHSTRMVTKEASEMLPTSDVPETVVDM